MRSKKDKTKMKNKIRKTLMPQEVHFLPGHPRADRGLVRTQLCLVLSRSFLLFLPDAKLDEDNPPGPQPKDLYARQKGTGLVLTGTSAHARSFPGSFNRICIITGKTPSISVTTSPSTFHREGLEVAES